MGCLQLYVDVESGTTAKRINLQRLIEDAKQRKFDIILAKELSRLARNGGLSYQIKSIAEQNHIHIVTLDNAINTLDGNIHQFGLFAWIYEQESQRISDRIKSVLGSKARSGEFKGSIPPYGYRLENKRLILADDDTPNVIKCIFRMYLEGKGFDAIARSLTREGYPTPAQVAGKKNAGVYWQGTSVKKILSNPHYVGDLVQGRQTTRSVTSKVRIEIPKDKHVVCKNAHPPIISREDFEAVQQYMEGRKKQQAKPKAKKHLFTNYLYCADCGKALVRVIRAFLIPFFFGKGRKSTFEHFLTTSSFLHGFFVLIHGLVKSGRKLLLPFWMLSKKPDILP
ncbi:recombinase family protein [Aneurinibacillus aneurinilyticus]|jgi:DNA invertase Pin-like site-specific DNA recombinase|uniref:recombinase family protein n=1 Tax=Aneurinibacillus aneurinilyticus TaxID=1391 RepID=UPI0023F45A68|nr:recombinase family protein [Aneurinibacillus aneurinilyticus]